MKRGIGDGGNHHDLAQSQRDALPELVAAGQRDIPEGGLQAGDVFGGAVGIGPRAGGLGELRGEPGLLPHGLQIHHVLRRRPPGGHLEEADRVGVRHLLNRQADGHRDRRGGGCAGIRIGDLHRRQTPDRHCDRAVAVSCVSDTNVVGSAVPAK